MSPGIAFFLGIWAATTYERKGWRGFLKLFVLPMLALSLIGALVVLIAQPQ
ncbi:ABC transporter [Neisseria cinerea]|uniref:ABC transporter n=1 Tax=Neisseria cinerea TaxID=483 RepID=UPI000196E7D9|nr:ABC transporter [Neisseria cinerea]MCD2071574.1 ABC transporter [Neisseria cinerea]